MSVVTYSCPCCGAPLRYAGGKNQLQCDACGNSFDLEAVQAFQETGSQTDIDFDLSGGAFSPEELAAMSGYTCQHCGAELMTEATTAATVCPYCGSPAVLTGQINSGIKPEMVIPFRISKEQAESMFQAYFTGKRLLPKVFLNTANRIAEIRQLYVPYWLFDCEAVADITYDATRRHVFRQGEWEVVRTEHYAVRRAGTLMFEHIPVDGSRKMDNRISESLEPYAVEDAVPFRPAVLAGAMADCADVDAEECRGRAAERVAVSTEEAFRRTVSGYSSVSPRRRDIRAQRGKATPVLMPVWMITTEKTLAGQKRIFTFAINGQTGALTCDVPYDKGKARLWFLGIFAAAFGAGYLLLRLLMRGGVLG